MLVLEIFMHEVGQLSLYLFFFFYDSTFSTDMVQSMIRRNTKNKHKDPANWHLHYKITVRRQIVEGQSVEGQSVEVQSVEGQSLEGQSVEGQNDEERKCRTD